MLNNNWYDFSNLKKSEHEASKLNDSELSVKSDFGSYRKVLNGGDFDASMLSSHNDLNPRNKIDFIHKWTSFDKDVFSKTLFPSPEDPPVIKIFIK